MTRSELIRMIDHNAKKLGLRLEEFGMNRRILPIRSSLEWDIIPKDGKLEVTRRDTTIGAVELGKDIMEPDYVISVMRALATGEASGDGTSEAAG